MDLPAGSSNNIFSAAKGIGDDYRLQLLPYEQNLMVDTLMDDVLFILAKGLGLESLFFNHLHFYSNPEHTVFVINTTGEDEHFFLTKLRHLNPECPPKLITADVLGKDREIIYKTGGVQFVTSRILMVDLLTDRVPIDKVLAILVYRAHELLHGFQESFILRLFREKKPFGGLVKAFTDNALRVAGEGIGQLQRLVSLLYLRRVVLLPRFHAEVKTCFEQSAPKLTQVTVELDVQQRRVQASLRDIIGTCVRELKQCTKEQLDPEAEREVLAPSATLHQTRLEVELSRRDMALTERQQRIIGDLQILRRLFFKVENLDPTHSQTFVHWIRTDKEHLHCALEVQVLSNNSGWLFTQSAATLFSGIESLCSLRDAEGNRTISPPPKWSVFCTLLEEICVKMATEEKNKCDGQPSSHVLVLAANEELSRQLIDLVKFGERRYTWMRSRHSVQPSMRDSMASAPPAEPLWNPVMVARYDAQLNEKAREDLRVQVKVVQKEIKRRAKMNEMEAAKLSKQPRLDQFGIQPCAKKSNGVANKRGQRINISSLMAQQKSTAKETPEPPSLMNKLPLVREQVPEGMLPEDPLTSFYKHQEEEERKNGGGEERGSQIVLLDGDEERSSIPLINNAIDQERGRGHSISNYPEQNETNPLPSADGEIEALPTAFKSPPDSMLVFAELSNHNYQLIQCLEQMLPRHVVLYSADLTATRVIEVFKAQNANHAMELYALVCADSSEEERHLASIQRESEAIEMLIREQATLLVPREFDVARESISQLRRLNMTQKRRVDSRNKSAAEDPTAEGVRPLVIVDMREFNSELPTVLYRRGVDLHAATLEVGDYVLSPDICVERKALDDLAQSVSNGRLFKQVEQMLRNYPKCILLIESNEKFRSNKAVRVGAFQGELTKRARETRALFAMLIRSYPQLHVFWSVSPAHSAEFFEELKLDQPDPHVDAALLKKRTRTLTAAMDQLPIENDDHAPA